MTPPLLFTFGLHFHQPVGNFDWVLTQHLDDVYRPLLQALEQGECWPVTLHLSGPLLEWLEGHAPAYLDMLGGHVAGGRIELLLAGYDEPILAVLPRDHRVEQIQPVRHRTEPGRHPDPPPGGLPRPGPGPEGRGREAGREEGAPSIHQRRSGSR